MKVMMESRKNHCDNINKPLNIWRNLDASLLVNVPIKEDVSKPKSEPGCISSEKNVHREQMTREALWFCNNPIPLSSFEPDCYKQFSPLVINSEQEPSAVVVNNESCMKSSNEIIDTKPVTLTNNRPVQENRSIEIINTSLLTPSQTLLNGSIINMKQFVPQQDQSPLLEHILSNQQFPPQYQQLLDQIPLLPPLPQQQQLQLQSLQQLQQESLPPHLTDQQLLQLLLQLLQFSQIISQQQQTQLPPQTPQPLCPQQQLQKISLLSPPLIDQQPQLPQCSASLPQQQQPLQPQQIRLSPTQPQHQPPISRPQIQQQQQIQHKSQRLHERPPPKYQPQQPYKRPPPEYQPRRPYERPPPEYQPQHPYERPPPAYRPRQPYEQSPPEYQLR